MIEHFLKISDYSAGEILHFLDLAAELKAAKAAGCEPRYLDGRNIAILFEKSSTRTRCAFEVAASDQGAHSTFIGSSGSHFGVEESLDDTVKVLGRMFDGIAYRGFAQKTVQQMSRVAGVPVWNALTDEAHPTQALADLLTIREHSDKPFDRISVAFVGDCRFNVCNSLLVACSKLGVDFRAVCPPPLQPSLDLLASVAVPSGRPGEWISASVVDGDRSGIVVTDDLDRGLQGCDFVYTDVWVSMGEPDSIWDERVELLRPFRVDTSLMDRTGNPGCKFMHCLPSIHDATTRLGAELYGKYGLNGMEVSDDVFSSERSIVFDQAENRLHTIKAVMVHSLAGKQKKSF